MENKKFLVKLSTPNGNHKESFVKLNLTFPQFKEMVIDFNKNNGFDFKDYIIESEFAVDYLEEIGFDIPSNFSPKAILDMALNNDFDMNMYYKYYVAYILEHSSYEEIS